MEPVLVKQKRNFVRENHRWVSTGTGKISGTLMTYLKGKATQRGLSFEVTSEQLWNLFQTQKSCCVLSGVPLTLSTTINKSHNLDRTNHTASLDRIDNTKGYTIDNVQWIHKVLNHMRRQYSVEEYVTWCRLVTQHQDKLVVSNGRAPKLQSPDTAEVVVSNGKPEDWTDVVDNIPSYFDCGYNCGCATTMDCLRK